MMLNDFHFLRPLWFLAMIPLALLLWRQARTRLRSRSWEAVCDAHLLPHILIDKGAGSRSRRPVWILALCSLLAIFALAGPTWERLPQPVFRKESALVILLDLSNSMNAADLTPSRLERARYKVADILKRRQEGQTALVVYAGAPFTVAPLTDDTATIEAMLGSLETGIMPAQGSRTDLALEKAAELLGQAGVQGGEVLLVTDGADPDKCLQAIDQLRQGKHRLSVLGIGTEEGAPIPAAGGGFLKDRAGSIVVPKLDPASLKAVARLGGGRYRPLSVDERDLDALLSPSDKITVADKAESTTHTSERWREQGPWLLLPLLFLTPLAFRRGLLTLVLLGLFTLPSPARAVDWDQLWSRSDQKGARAFANNDMERAARHFADPRWKAAAHYRGGNYTEAAEELEQISSTDAHYNRGNALARQGKLQEALAAYEEALKLDSQNEDAAYNRDLIRKEMQRQQQPQQGNGQSDQNPAQDESAQSQESSAGQDNGSGQGQDGSNPEDTGENRPAPSRDPRQSETSEQNQAGQRPDKEEESAEASPASDDRAESAPENDAADPSLQASEQWLRRIPDDPGGLLRRKFQYQYRNQPHSEEEQPW